VIAAGCFFAYFLLAYFYLLSALLMRAALLGTKKQEIDRKNSVVRKILL
jgi:hypothetical protein